jgi:hypothetical protein
MKVVQFEDDREFEDHKPCIIETPRLFVHVVRLMPNENFDTQLAFLAFGKDHVSMVAHAMIGSRVEWIEVSAERRRDWFGTELMDAVNFYFGFRGNSGMTMRGATEAGKAFCAAYETWRER